MQHVEPSEPFDDPQLIDCLTFSDKDQNDPYFNKALTDDQFPTPNAHIKEYRVEHFHGLIESIDSHQVTASSILNSSLILDWSKESIDLSSPDVEIRVQHYIDYIALEGKPKQPLSSSHSSIFSSIQFTLNTWYKPYGNTRYGIQNVGAEYVFHTVHLGSHLQCQWYLVLKIPKASYSINIPAKLPIHRYYEIRELVINVFQNTQQLYKFGINHINYQSSHKKVYHFNYFNVLIKRYMILIKAIGSCFKKSCFIIGTTSLKIKVLGLIGNISFHQCMCLIMEIIHTLPYLTI